MSEILIRGMEMPKEDHVLVIDFTGAVWTYKWPSIQFTQIGGATVIQLPPHGRLIDADEFVSDLVFPTPAFEREFRSMVNDAPTIIPASKIDCLDGDRREPYANIDRIKSMSVENMAKWLWNHDQLCFKEGGLTIDGYIKWLQKEVQDIG